MSFYELIRTAWKQNNSLVCVGLDTDPDRIPSHFHGRETAIFEFNKAIIEATADVACAYKPQIAYYSAHGAEVQLQETIAFIHETCPGIPVILDAKRGDIGSTAAMYAREAFIRYEADAVTVNPYLGLDSLKPFMEYTDRGIIALCRTSNPGARDLQDLRMDGKPLYVHVAELAAGTWNANRNLGLVVGATYPDELREIRSIVGDMPLLVPGIGAQGGDVKAAVRAGLDSTDTGMIINSSRGIIYAGEGRDFADMARRAAVELRDQINKHRT